MLINELFTVAEVEELVNALHTRMHECAQKLHAYRDAVEPVGTGEIPFAYNYKNICYFSNVAFSAMMDAINALVCGNDLDKIQWLQVIKAIRKTESKRLFDKVSECLYSAENCVSKPLDCDWAQAIVNNDIRP